MKISCEKEHPDNGDGFSADKESFEYSNVETTTDDKQLILIYFINV